LNVLALDTSTEACSVAIRIGEESVERFDPNGLHSNRILQMVDELLAEAGIQLSQMDAIAFGRGPGSFTGLRIGAGVAQGLAFALDIPVTPVSSLVALAQGVDAPKVLGAFDARMNQVYFGYCIQNDRGVAQLLDEEQVVSPLELPIPDDRGWVGVGNGWDRYHAELTQRLGNRVVEWRQRIYPHARDIAHLGALLFESGKAVRPELALPIYVRDDVAVKQRKTDEK